MVSDHQRELERLVSMEYGGVPELIFRYFGTLLGAVILYLYTGWMLAWVWFGVYFVLHRFYFWFLRSRGEDPKFRDVVIAIGLFLLIFCVYIWMPILMVMQPDEALQVCGSCIVGCLLVFLIRRTEKYGWMVIAEVGLFSLAIMAAIAVILSRQDSVYAYIGITLSASAVILYLTQSILVVRKQRLRADAAAERSIQSQKMEAIGQLAGGVAHDFNNLLTAVIGNLDLYEEIEDPEERSVFIRDARKAALRGTKVVDQLLQYARQSEEQQTYVTGDTLLTDVASLGRHIVKSATDIVVEPVETDLWVHIDESQLTTAILNLISNGADAIAGEGRVTLSATRRKLNRDFLSRAGKALPPGEYVAFTVLDSGPGVPEQVLSRAADPFFTTKPPGHGSGLGLAMVSGLAERSNGVFTLENARTGTKATILLPLVRPEPEPDAAAAQHTNNPPRPAAQLTA